MKFKSQMYLMLYSAIILLVLWALQFLFLNTFYMRMKTNEVVKISDKVVEDYNDSGTANIADYAAASNIRITVLDETGRIADGSDGFGMMMQPGASFFPTYYYEKIQEEFSNSNDDTIHFTAQSEEGGMAQIVYAAKVDVSSSGFNYLCIISPVPPIDSTTTVLQMQFYIIAAILLLMSVIIGQIMSKKMSAPIVKLTKSAKRLAGGDLNSNYEGEGYTEIYELADTLNYATKELAKTDDYRKDLIANVSHDLKTPLTVIKMYGEMIRDITDNNPEKRDEYSERIIKEADWLSSMVNELLELSKLEAIESEIKKKTISISTCLEETLLSFEALAFQEGYTFITDIEEEVWINGNERYIKRVLYNLISNAINYTGEDKKVTISLRKNEGKARFEVTDTGEGIEPEKLVTIWDRYYKSNKAHKRAVVGTGLGLSIVKHTLELHSARYGVVSSIGEGSTFWFEI